MSLTAHAAATPDKPALITTKASEDVSFKTLNDLSIRLSRILRRDLDVGDRVALLMENGAAYYVAAWAARRSGLRFVPVNWHLTVEEAAYIVENSDARALIVSPGLAGIAQAIADRNPALTVRILAGQTVGALDELLAEEPASPLEDETEGVYMFYSSGTTGQPKGILRALSGKPFGARMAIETRLAEHYGFGPDTLLYCPAPLYHAAPLAWSMGAQLLGGTAVVPPRFDAEATLRDIERYGVTHAQFVPTHFVRLLQLPKAVRERYDLSSLRMVVHAAAPCPIDVKEKMLAWWGPIIHEYYGLSEGGGFTAVGPEEWLTHKGTVGRSLTGNIYVVDDDDQPLPPGEIGHIMFENAERFQYHKEPAKTAAFFDDKGSARPGDMGWMDADGYLYLADRATNLIISGGVNIYPQEAEAVLTLHPAVFDVAVIGVPNAEFGEDVKAVIQPAAGVVADKALADELMALCRGRLAGFKCPKSIDFVDELPRLPTGKLLKRELRQRYWGERRGLAV